MTRLPGLLSLQSCVHWFVAVLDGRTQTMTCFTAQPAMLTSVAFCHPEWMLQHVSNDDQEFKIVDILRYKRTNAHTHAHARAHTHTCACGRMRTHTLEHTHTHTRACEHACIVAHTHARMRARTHAYMCTHTLERTHVLTNACTHAQMCAQHL